VAFSVVVEQASIEGTGAAAAEVAKTTGKARIAIIDKAVVFLITSCLHNRCEFVAFTTRFRNLSTTSFQGLEHAFADSFATDRSHVGKALGSDGDAIGPTWEFASAKDPFLRVPFNSH
jgi:hypothetical protein